MGYNIVNKYPKPLPIVYSKSLNDFIMKFLDKIPQSRPKLADAWKRFRLVLVHKSMNFRVRVNSIKLIIIIIILWMIKKNKRIKFISRIINLRRKLQILIIKFKEICRKIQRMLKKNSRNKRNYNNHNNSNSNNC